MVIVRSTQSHAQLLRNAKTGRPKQKKSRKNVISAAV